MKTHSTIFLILIAVPLLATINAAPVFALGKTPLQAERTMLMRGMSGAVKAIKGAGNPGAAIGPAKIVVRNSGMLKSRFAYGSGGGASRAKSEIWQNLDDVKGRLGNVQSAAAKLLKIAESGGAMGAVKAALDELRGNCNGCHSIYRMPKK